MSIERRFDVALIVDTVFVCRACGTVPENWLFDSPERLVEILSKDLAHLSSAGREPTPRRHPVHRIGPPYPNGGMAAPHHLGSSGAAATGPSPTARMEDEASDTGAGRFQEVRPAHTSAHLVVRRGTLSSLTIASRADIVGRIRPHRATGRANPHSPSGRDTLSGVPLNKLTLNPRDASTVRARIGRSTTRSATCEHP